MENEEVGEVLDVPKRYDDRSLKPEPKTGSNLLNMSLEWYSSCVLYILALIFP